MGSGCFSKRPILSDNELPPPGSSIKLKFEGRIGTEGTYWLLDEQGRRWLRMVSSHGSFAKLWIDRRGVITLEDAKGNPLLRCVVRGGIEEVTPSESTKPQGSVSSLKPADKCEDVSKEVHQEIRRPPLELEWDWTLYRELDFVTIDEEGRDIDSYCRARIICDGKSVSNNPEVYTGHWGVSITSSYIKDLGYAMNFNGDKNSIDCDEQFEDFTKATASTEDPEDIDWEFDMEMSADCVAKVSSIKSSENRKRQVEVLISASEYKKKKTTSLLGHDSIRGFHQRSQEVTVSPEVDPLRRAFVVAIMSTVFGPQEIVEQMRKIGKREVEELTAQR